MKFRIIAPVAGKSFFNTIRSWAIVNSLEDCESRVIAAVTGNCELVGAL